MKTRNIKTRILQKLESKTKKKYIYIYIYILKKNKEKKKQGENNARKNQGNRNLKTPQKEILRKSNDIYIYIRQSR
jgi:hypothetical protein